jgi:hypothetical protein
VKYEFLVSISTAIEDGAGESTSRVEGVLGSVLEEAGLGSIWIEDENGHEESHKVLDWTVTPYYPELWPGWSPVTGAGSRPLAAR